MKRVLFVFCFLFFVFCSNAQWQNVGGGVDQAFAGMTVYNNLLYVGGGFTQVGSLYASCIATWNGSNWDTVGPGLTHILPSNNTKGVNCILGDDSMLFIGGQFDSAGNVPAKSVAQWNGLAWDSVGRGITNVVGQNVLCMCRYKGQIYAGGNFVVYSTSIAGIARWDGVKWDSVGSGLNGVPYAMVVYNGELYAAGSFTNSGAIHTNSIAKWDGTKWDSVGGGINGNISALCVCNGNLYVGGQIFSAGGVPSNNIAVWDGTNWDSVGHGVNNEIEAFATFNNELFAGGAFDTAGGQPISYIAEWDGSNWLPMGAGLSGGDWGVWALAIYDSTLYAGGGFTNSGSTPLYNIAMWKGPLGVDEVKSNSEEVKVWPNPSQGIFNFTMQNQLHNSTIEIYDILGEVIYQHNINSVTTSIDISSRQTGMYLYRILSGKGEALATGKLIIQ